MHKKRLTRLFGSSSCQHDSWHGLCMVLTIYVLCTSSFQDLANEAAGKPLQPKQLAQALGVAQALADVLGASGGGATAGKAALTKTAASGGGAGKQADVVLVPDESGVMLPAADLAFDDAPWLDGPNAGKVMASEWRWAGAQQLSGMCLYR